jgi:hypothetical protein
VKAATVTHECCRGSMTAMRLRGMLAVSPQADEVCGRRRDHRKNWKAAALVADGLGA